ncbi:MAG TPA: hypothetical protein VHM88_10075, partial [Candidatus Acidoferrales bacterium]|nr:hypothetical protein [Candidatus Acidoferrales bacterium]
LERIPSLSRTRTGSSRQRSVVPPPPLVRHTGPLDRHQPTGASLTHWTDLLLDTHCFSPRGWAYHFF